MFYAKKKFRAIVCTAAVAMGLLFCSGSVMILGKTDTKTQDHAQVQSSAQKAIPEQTEIGIATYYGGAPRGKKLVLTAAHKFLPRGTILRVESLEGPHFKTIEVEISDRMPDWPVNRGRVIDLAKKSAIAMNPTFIRKGVLKVKLTVISMPTRR